MISTIGLDSLQENSLGDQSDNYEGDATTFSDLMRLNVENRKQSKELTIMASDAFREQALQRILNQIDSMKLETQGSAAKKATELSKDIAF